MYQYLQLNDIELRVKSGISHKNKDLEITLKVHPWTKGYF